MLKTQWFCYEDKDDLSGLESSKADDWGLPLRLPSLLTPPPEND